MTTHPRFFTNTPRRPRVGPSDPAFACGIFRSARPEGMPIGIAFPDGYIGGAGIEAAAGETDGPPELIWRLQVGKEWLEGRYALRGGEFVELAEDAG